MENIFIVKKENRSTDRDTYFPLSHRIYTIIGTYFNFHIARIVRPF